MRWAAADVDAKVDAAMDLYRTSRSLGLTEADRLPDVLRIWGKWDPTGPYTRAQHDRFVSALVQALIALEAESPAAAE